MTQVMKRIGLFAAIESVLFLSGILTILTPLPVMMAYRRSGVFHAIGVSGFAAIIIFSISHLLDPNGALQAMSLFSTSSSLAILTAIGFTLGYGLRAKWSFSKLLVFPIVQLSIMFVVVVVTYYGGIRGGFGTLILDLEKLAEFSKNQLIQTTSTLKDSGSGSEIQAFLDSISHLSTAELAQRFLTTLPLYTFWGISIVTWVLVHSGIYTQIIREWRELGVKGSAPDLLVPEKAPPSIKPWIMLWKDSYFWRTPDFFILPWLGSGVLTLLIKEPLQHEMSFTVFKILGTFYAFQGFSFVRYMLEHFRIPGFLRIAAYFLLILIPGMYGFFALMALGVLDFWADFRKKNFKLGEAK